MTRKTYPSLIMIACLSTHMLFAQSKAHEQSKFAVIDPAYSAAGKKPAENISGQGAVWPYGPAELECYRLDLLQRRKDLVKLNVGYTGVFHPACIEGSFRLSFKGPQMELK